MTTTALATDDTAAPVALDDLAPILAAYDDFDRRAKQWASARDDLRRIIEARLGTAEIGTIDGEPRVRRTRALVRRVDRRRLRQLAPAALLTACTVESERVQFGLIKPAPPANAPTAGPRTKSHTCAAPLPPPFGIANSGFARLFI